MLFPNKNDIKNLAFFLHSEKCRINIGEKYG
jgi:hypothetical protein